MEVTAPEKREGIANTKRNQLVVFAIIAALALMFWAGWANYESRKQARERKAMYTLLVPDQGQSGSQQSGSQQSDPSQSGQSADEEMPTRFNGKPAPAFTLTDLSGKKVSLADYKGRAVLLNFWATWCGPCKVEIPWFLKLREQYAARGFEVIGVSSDDLDKNDKKLLAEETADIAKFAKNESITYPILIDGDSISHPYGGVDSLPTSFFIDRNGTIVAQTIGLVSRDQIEANIKKALGSEGL